ncbi:MAG: 30S ribosomal protein S3 [Candidatus Aureabacteria bacterium]|nr:30S ribosomal protein S3 [Candidatus Auribacterota bacterium]
MGQKVNPISFRLGTIKTWSSKWFAESKNFGKLLEEDLQIRKYIKKKLDFASITEVLIERASEKVRVVLKSARPGVVIGRRGAEIEKIKEDLAKITKKNVLLDVEEVKNPDTDANLIAQNVAVQLARRVSFRRAMKRALQVAMQQGAKGIKIMCSGRLGGAEMSRTESYKEGKIPLHTIRADIDYAFAESKTTYGIIGVKVWVYKGEILIEKHREQSQAAPQKV